MTYNTCRVHERVEFLFLRLSRQRVTWRTRNVWESTGWRNKNKHVWNQRHAFDFWDTEIKTKKISFSEFRKVFVEYEKNLYVQRNVRQTASARGDSFSEALTKGALPISFAATFSFWLSKHLKSKVYTNKPRTQVDFRDSITSEIASITVGECLRKRWQTLVSASENALPCAYAICRTLCFTHGFFSYLTKTFRNSLKPVVFFTSVPQKS